MAGAWTTKNIRDASGVSTPMRVWDESGSGSGPFSFGQVLAGGDGDAVAHAEDAAHVSGDKGFLALAVRKDTATALAGTDADYIPLICDASGKLWVAATLAAGTGATDLGKAEDAAHASGETGVMMLAVRKDTAAALAGTDGDYAVLEVDANGRLHVIASAGVADGADATQGITTGTKVVTDAAGTVQQYMRGVVTFFANALGAGTAAAAHRTTLASDDPAVATLGAISGAAVVTDANGTIQQYLRGIVKLMITAGTTVLGAGAALIGKVGIDQTTPGTTNAVSLAQIGGTAIVNGGVAGSQSIGGTVATNVAITANPLNLGAQAVSSENAAVTTARQVQLVADLAGKLIILPYANPENFVSGAITSAMTGTTSTSLVAAPAAGLRNYITTIIVSNAHATQGTDVIIQDGSGGTTLLTIPAAAVYGGAAITLPVPLRQPTTATAIYCANVTTGASTKVSAVGYKGA